MLTYRLELRAPLHLGERGVGLEATRVYAPADTLFGAICSAWRALYGLPALEALLALFQQAPEPPFLLSSAFPFAGKVRFYPRPRVHITITDDSKALKRVRFVSAGVLDAMRTGTPLTFSKALCLNGQVAWATEAEKEILIPWASEESGDVRLWKTHVVPRVQLDRISSQSDIWHFGETVFAEGTGLWFAVQFHPGHTALRTRFEASLRLLGETGLGGERTAGRGLFHVQQPEEFPTDEPATATHFITLAPLCPRSPEELDALLGETASYHLVPRRGWITSPEASTLRFKSFWMLAEGSVCTKPTSFPAGRLVDVRPDACPHPVWRYGYAFPLFLTLP
jgi:CRISPR-associated protein Csm4